MKTLTLLLGSIILFGLSSFNDDGAKSKLPDVKVKNLDGTEVNIQSFVDSGNLTIVAFWATWCKPCILELDNMSELYDDWKEKYNVKIVAVSIDDARNISRIKPVADSRGWEYDIVSDANQDLARAMNVTNPPVLFVINDKNEVVYTHQSYVPGDEDTLEEHLKELTAKKKTPAPVNE